MPKPILLIVDDEPDHRVSLEQFLRTRLPDVHVVSEGDPDAALARIAAEEVALLVTDYRMPRIDGVHLLRRAKKISPSTIRILMSAYPKQLVQSFDSENPDLAHRVFLKPLETAPFVRYLQGVFGPVATSRA